MSDSVDSSNYILTVSSLIFYSLYLIFGGGGGGGVLTSGIQSNLPEHHSILDQAENIMGASLKCIFIMIVNTKFE